MRRPPPPVAPLLAALLAAATGACTATRASDARVGVESGRGVTFTAADGSASMNLRGRIQLRDTLRSDAEGESNELHVRTVRLHLQGHTLAPEFRYGLQLALGGRDFDAEHPSPVFDAWVEYAGWRDLHLRAGQFFVPFDRARTIREFALQLVDRPDVVSELSLDRDVGVKLHSADLFGLGGTLAYEAGVFGGEGRNRFGPSRPAAGLLYVGRIAYRPFGAFDDDIEGDLDREWRPRLSAGLAAAYNRGTRRSRSTHGPALVSGTTDYLHGAADLVFKYAGFSFLGEVLVRSARRSFREAEVDGQLVRAWSREGWGFLAQGGYLFTRRLEATARYGELRARGATDPEFETAVREQGRELAAGLNAYLNRHFLKLQADLSLKWGDDIGQATRLARVQLDATF